MRQLGSLSPTLIPFSSSGTMKRQDHTIVSWRIIGIVLAFCPGIVGPAFAQSLNSESAYDMVDKDSYADLFQKGDTNAPLLAMDWFRGPRVDEFCRVSRSGTIQSAREVINWAIQGGHRGQLDHTHLQSLIAIINVLPPPTKSTLPQERWLVLRGIRTNEWFKYIYDRADVPKEVEQLYAITGAYLEWSIPLVEGRSITTNSDSSFFIVAKDASVGISSSSRGIQLWDLNLEHIQDTLPSDIVPLRPGFRHSRALSPDGTILIEAKSGGTYWDESGVCAVDLKKGQTLWKTHEPEHEGCYDQHLAVGGDKGQFAFVAGAHTIERWDLATGKCVAVLATNRPTVQFLKTSQDGKILVAGFNTMNGQCWYVPSAFTVWRVDVDKPAAHIDEGRPVAACISPDGQIIALSVFGDKSVQLWDWQNGTKQELPLRLPYGELSVASMSWSPDRTRVAANVSAVQKSIIVYDAITWKPLACWPNHDQNFEFARNGKIIDLSDCSGACWGKRLAVS
jgi:hypothetical protein